MATTQDNEKKSNMQRPVQPASPDGQSGLPLALVDFPPPTSDPSGDSGPSTGK